MKIIVTERQYKLLREQQEVLELPSLEYFGSWDILQKYLERRGFPPYSIAGDLDLRCEKITSLGNLTSVGGYLNLYNTLITSLGNLISVSGNLDLGHTNIESLGNLISVDGALDLENAPIKSLGNLTSVGGDLYLGKTPLSKKYSREEIRSIIDVGGNIYL